MRGEGMKFRIEEWQFIQDVMHEQTQTLQKEMWKLEEKDNDLYNKWKRYADTGDFGDDENVIAYDAIHNKQRIARDIWNRIYEKRFD